MWLILWGEACYEHSLGIYSRLTTSPLILCIASFSFNLQLLALIIASPVRTCIICSGCSCSYIPNETLDLKRRTMLWFHWLWDGFPSDQWRPSHAQHCVFCCRRASRGRSTTSTTPHGPTLVSQNLLPPSSISSWRSGSPAHWTQSTGPRWCTAAPGSDAQGPSPWWTPAWSWWEQEGDVVPSSSGLNTSVAKCLRWKQSVVTQQIQVEAGQ